MKFALMCNCTTPAPFPPTPPATIVKVLSTTQNSDLVYSKHNCTTAGTKLCPNPKQTDKHSALYNLLNCQKLKWQKMFYLFIFADLLADF